MGCCTVLAGILKSCGAAIGGIKSAWIACADDVTGVTVTADQVSAIAASAGAFKEFQFRKDTGNFTTTINSDTTTGTLNYTTDIVLQFLKQETAKRIEVQALAQSDLAVIVLDSNGTYWYFGDSYPVTLSAGTGETGTALADFNGYNVTLQDVNLHMPYEVTKAAMDTLLNAA